MFTLLLFAQLATAAPAQDSTYATSALRELIARAAAANHAPPPELHSYRSHIETEFSVLVRDTLGRELSAQIEQLASTATWSRDERYELHVDGYRSQTLGVPYSALNAVRAWTVPTLYGERLTLGAYPANEGPRDTIVGVHPFAGDRDQYYRFSGGDTVTVLHAGTRAIPIVRIHVHPAFHGRTRFAAFDGEIDLDALRAQIVRMRGRFVVLGPRTKAESRIRMLGLVSAAYVEFVNGEIAGRYWLPSFQRTEFQASIPLFGQTRPVFRLVSAIDHIVVNDTGPLAAQTTSPQPRILVTWAPSDSVNSYSQWEHSLGEQTGAVHSDDFQDIAPDAWRSTGTPLFTLFPNTTGRILRFNRVEGLFTGLAPSVDFRSVVPGLSASIYGGWAWKEQTARGGAAVTYHRGANILAVRGERELASTNDFVPAFGDDPGLSALLSSVDDADYVDRRVALGSATHMFGGPNDALATLQFGGGDDRGEQARLSQGLVHGPGFRPNRGVASGSYALAVAQFEFHPNVSDQFVQPGVGLRAHYEAGAGELSWQRAEIGLVARRYLGPVSLTARADGGMLFGATPPPQQLFELGGNEALPGYAYKEFAGDRAALFRTFASYHLPVYQRPFRIRRFLLPGLAPGVALSVQGGWTEISSAGARTAVQQLGAGWSPTPVSDETHGARATFGTGLTFFSDVLHIGVARPVDHPAPWKLVAGFGTVF